MKQRFLSFLSLIVLLPAPSLQANDFDDDHRLVFYAVLEGCYEDGLSNEDIARILVKNKKETNFYANFVYACPLCTPTIHALETYRSRPPHFYGLKTHKTTFGPGLAPDLKAQLYSEKSEDQLAAINTLMRGWVSKRIAQLRLSDEERGALQKKLERMREKGTNYLKGREKEAQDQVSAFSNVHQCAVCNGACDLPLKPQK